ncbi:MAG TPA: chemotaxis protein CheW, partial [Candidatus Ozemobacteraceae bacterium]
ASAPAAQQPPAPPAQPPSGTGDAPEEAEQQKEVIELVQLVSFQMAGETYALEIKQVEGIINMLPMTRVPKSPPHIEGVINLRGEILPVINLRRRLKQAEKARTHEDQIIILSFEREKVKVGFLVDRVQEVLRLPQSAIEPPSHVSEGVNVEHLRGVGKLGNRIIILLNAEKIVFG